MSETWKTFISVWEDYNKGNGESLRMSGGVTSRIFNHVSTWKRVLILTFRPLFPRGRRSRCISDRTMGRLKSQAWRDSQKKNQFPRRESKSVASRCTDRVILLYYVERAPCATLWNSIRRTAAAATLLSSWYRSSPAEHQLPKDQPRSGRSDWRYFSIRILSVPTARSEDPGGWQNGRSPQG